MKRNPQSGVNFFLRKMLPHYHGRPGERFTRMPGSPWALGFQGPAGLFYECGVAGPLVGEGRLFLMSKLTVFPILLRAIAS